MMRFSGLPFPLGWIMTTAFALPCFASDHGDSLGAANDPQADLLDLYAFVAPLCVAVDEVDCEDEPEELILALTVNPQATGATRFSPGIVYHFYLENDTGVTTRIDCTFNDEQVVSCAGPGDLYVEAQVGESVRNGDLRVFAGLRDDPFFFDKNAFAELPTQGLGAFSPPGKDFHAGANVMALVLGVRINAIPAGAGLDTNRQKIWAASERIAGVGLNGGITGSWYNPAQDGQGWVIEVVRIPSLPDQFLVYFYGYDNRGEQLWLIGVGPGIQGQSATVEVIRTSGMGFGGDYDPHSMTSEPVGTMTFTFWDCHSGTVEFVPNNGDLQAFVTDIVRLTRIESVNCTLFTGGQVDRQGRPLASEFFVPESMRQAYNVASDPDNWAAQFKDEIAAGITTLDLADGVAGNLFTGDPQTLAAILSDDRLQVDLAQANCFGYGAVEMADLTAQPLQSCGGRTPFYDVADDMLGLVVTGFEPDVHDFINWNDAEFLMEFPYLAAPHGPLNIQTFEWPESTPAAQGLDPVLVGTLYESAAAIGHLYSLLLVKDGFLIAEEYFNGMDAADANYIASVTKSVISALIGIALEEQALTSLDQKLAEFFPEVDWGDSDPRKSQITIRQLLQMRSGYPWEEFSGYQQTIQSSLNWIPFLAEFPLSAAPGAQFGYSNLSSHMLSIILQRATGESTLSYAKTRLFKRLGVELRYWPRDGLGYYFGSHGIHLRPRDLAKFGQMYLDGGMFNGRRILPDDWVNESFQPYSEETYGEPILTYAYPLRYGYQWWSSTAGNYNFNYAWGHGGQLIVVLSELDMIIVTTASDFGGLPGELTWPQEKSIHDLVGGFISSLP